MDDASSAERKGRRSKRWLVVLVVIGAVLVGTFLFARREFYEFAARDFFHNGIGTLPMFYAPDHDGMYPPLSPEAGRLMFTVESVFQTGYIAKWVMVDPRDSISGPEYATTEAEARNLIDDHSFWYLGYAIENEVQGRAFADAYKKRIAAGETFETDLQVPAGEGNGGGDTIFRLRRNLEEFLAERIGASEISVTDIPVVIQRPRKRSRGFVSFYPGYAEEIAFPGKFPMTEEFIGILEELDAMGQGELVHEKS
ncbi:MAG: hypothetical protein AAB353_13715 [Candidatus Hydrogenedentota bacterium]